MSESLTEINLDPISKLLAVIIAENGDYSHVDKLGYVVSPDLAVYYLREALRDYSSLMNKTKWTNSKAYSVAKEIKMKSVEYIIDKISRINDPREVRRIVATIAAKALAKANSLRIETQEKEEGGEK